MADSTTTTSTALSTDVYSIASFVDAIKAKYIDIDEDTLTMGIYGYLGEMHQTIIEDVAVMAAEYSNEAIPTRAKFEKNIIAHAVSLGLKNISATPAIMETYICIPETNLLANMTNDQFILDKEYVINLKDSDTNTSYEYHLDYDIIIKRNLLPNGTYVYTGTYNIDKENEISDITNPYLPTFGIFTLNSTRMIMFDTYIHQVTHTTNYKSIISTNPLETKSMTFTFDDQLAYFYVEVVESDTTHNLECVYDGLYEEDTTIEYCNYLYLDTSTIRITFNRDSYQPTSNATVTIHVYTTKGSTCNFTYTDNPVCVLTSANYSYDNIYMVLRPITDSENGSDRKTIDEIRADIPKQLLMRDSVTTYTDLNNYFNQINTTDCRLYFLQKIHNQIERLYYAYLLLKVDSNIVPTNTLDVTINKSIYTNINTLNYVLQPGSLFYHNGTTCNAIASTTTSDKLTAYDSSGFLYVNPFLTIVNKSPFFVEYYLNILNYSKTLNFEYINSSSELQFVSATGTVALKRLYFTDRNTYKMTFSVTQNINTDFNMVVTDDNGNVQSTLVKAMGVIYVNDAAYRYMNATLTGYDDSTYTYTFEIDFTTNDIIDNNGNIYIEHGIYNLDTTEELATYFTSNITAKLYILAKFDTNYGNKDATSICPGLDDYTLCNIYTIENGIDLYYDYTNIMSSYINLQKNSDNTYSHVIEKMPLIRYTYLNSEDRVTNFIKTLEKRRLWIQACLVLLEDSFGVDFKFFNTYGPSKLYSLTSDGDTLLDRTNISLTFECKFEMANDSYITDDITTYIKEYMEDINDISELHMSNLTTAVKNEFSDQLVYFKFVGLNSYGYLYQSIYNVTTDEFVASTTVPEFINVNTLSTDEPDITYNVIS